MPRASLPKELLDPWQHSPSREGRAILTVVDMMAASAAVAPLLTGPPQRVEVAAVTSQAVYLTARGAGLCLATPAAVRLPCALVMRRLPVLAVGASGTVGRGGLTVGGWSGRVGRWWRPGRPTGLATASPARLAELAGVLAARTAVLDRWMDMPNLVPALAHALSGRGPGPTPPEDDLVPALVGRGPGLTPLGDDLLAGALVTLRALGSPRAEPLAAAVIELAPRTTVVSAILLRHAARGECGPELAAVLAPDPDAVDGLLGVGHSSGTGLAGGVLAALTAHGVRP